MEPVLLRGFVLGFTIAAAVGPIALLCIRRTLAEGRLVGLVSGLGVATADATYGAVAAFGLTLTNPMTILSFAALFVGLGVTAGDAAGAAVTTVGVFTGSATWWVVLVTAVGALRTRLTPAGLRRVNVVSGLVIAAFAIVAIASAVA